MCVYMHKSQKPTASSGVDKIPRVKNPYSETAAAASIEVILSAPAKNAAADSTQKSH